MKVACTQGCLDQLSFWCSCLLPSMAEPYSRREQCGRYRTGKGGSIIHETSAVKKRFLESMPRGAPARQALLLLVWCEVFYWLDFIKVKVVRQSFVQLPLMDRP